MLLIYHWCISNARLFTIDCTNWVGCILPVFSNWKIFLYFFRTFKLILQLLGLLSLKFSFLSYWIIRCNNIHVRWFRVKLIQRECDPLTRAARKLRVGVYMVSAKNVTLHSQSWTYLEGDLYHEVYAQLRTVPGAPNRPHMKKLTVQQILHWYIADGTA